MNYKLDKKYNSLDRIDKWDDETQEVIKKRISNEVGDERSYNFLTASEGKILELLIEVLIPQEENTEHINIPFALDQDLKKNLKKVRYHDNPWPQEFYQRGLAEFAETAKKKYEKALEAFSQAQLEKYVGEIFAGDPKVFLHIFLRKVLSDAAAVYYSHPAVWNGIGFPGPAYPEGYAYLDCGKAFDWEPKYEKK